MKDKKIILPLGEFMAYLRRQGFIIGVDHHLRLQALLNILGPDCRPGDLKYVLCPIFAVNEKQQQQFYRAFDSYFKPMETAGVKKIIPPGARESKDLESTGEPVSTPRWQYILLGVLLIVLAALLIYRWGSGPGITRPTGITQKTFQPPSAGDEGGKTGRETGGGVPAAKKEVDGLKKKAYKPSFWELYGYIFHGAGSLAPFIILFLFEFYKYNRRRLILMRQRGKKPPFFWHVKVEAPETGLVKNGGLYRAARLLRKRLKSDIFLLDVAKTVSGTVEKGGFPELRYKALTRPPEYLVLIDLPAYRDHHAHLFDTLARALEKEGLFVNRYFYESDPRVCFKEPGRQRVYLSELEARYSDNRLLVFGDGREWLDPVSGTPDSWTGIFSAWKERALLTPAPPDQWSLGEFVLAKEFIVLPASLEGLGALVEYFDNRAGYNPKEWKQADSQERILMPAVFDDIGALRNYLGKDLFQWLCACAVYPELHWDLTLYLGSLPCMPVNLIKEENLLRLIRLPWFSAGIIPDELRWKLISELDIEKSKAIRTAVIELLENDPAPRESYAYDSYRLNLVVQRWMLSGRDRRKRKEELKKSSRTIDEERIIQDYTLLRFLESTPKSPLHFVLPGRLRKLFYRKGVPFFGLRIGIRAALAIIIAAAVFIFLKPVDMGMPPDVRNVKSKGIEVYKNEKGSWEANYGDGIKMVYIQEGQFTMGSDDYDNEKPVHTVYLDGYWMGKYEGTVKQFALFVEDEGYITEAEKRGGAYTWTDKGWEMKKDANWKNPGFKQDDNHPVVCVSWNDARAYCEWLSKKKQLSFKLPTEAQWEKAARGTDSRKYPWGNNEPDETLANFLMKIGKTSPVGSYPQGSSPYGLPDMAGNVWEWCNDWYASDYYKNKNSPIKNPQGPEKGDFRVVRGGSWFYVARSLRCASRNFDRPSGRNYYVGFRLCQDN